MHTHKQIYGVVAGGLLLGFGLFLGQNNVGFNFFAQTAAVYTTGAPTTLTAANSGSTTPRVKLAWRDNSSNESYFEVYRSIDGILYSKIGTSPVNQALYYDNAVTVGQTYYYKVRAIDIERNTSIYTNQASVKVILLSTKSPADINADGVVNLADQKIVAAAFGSKIGDLKYNAAADLTHDGIVDLRDIQEVRYGYQNSSMVRDVTGDGKVDLTDQKLVATSFSSRIGDTRYNPVYDVSANLQPDGIIDLRDIQEIRYGYQNSSMVRDVNGDSKIDLADQKLVATSFTSRLGDAKYNPIYDVSANLQPDGIIDLRDIQEIRYGYQNSSMVRDVNGDAKVNLLDQQLVATAFGSRLGDARYNPIYDVSQNLQPDGIIDLRDIQEVRYGYQNSSMVRDVNGDGVVNFADQKIVAASYLSRLGDAKYNPIADVYANLQPDGNIDLRDIQEIRYGYAQSSLVYDVDGDGKVTINDKNIINKYIISQAYDVLVDINLDGKINSLDLAGFPI